MVTRPDPENHIARDASRGLVGLVAGALASLPFALALVLQLWALAGPCMTSGAATQAILLLLAGFAPFALTTRRWPGTPLAWLMERGRLGLFGGGYGMFFLLGPGPVALGVSCETGPGIVQSAAALTVIGWVLWTGLRFAEPDNARPD